MPMYMDKRRWEEIQASRTLQEVLSGKSVERERLIHMRLYLGEAESVRYWWAEDANADLESLRAQGANPWHEPPRV